MDSSRNSLLYRNESTKREILNHPRLKLIINHIKTEFSPYKFTVYRCASKLHALKVELNTVDIPYPLVLSVLERHRLGQSDETISVRRTQLSPVIHDIFYACDKLGHFAQRTAVDLEALTGVLSNFLWDVFDPNRSSPVTLLEVKETLLLLCRVNSMEEMITEFFNLASDHNKCISRLRLESILKILTKILSYIGESASYGYHTVPDILRQCFSQSHGVIGINEYEFNCLWNSKTNRFIIYANLIALVMRIKDTEKIVHTTSCISCSSSPISGIRFKCFSCRDLSLCMKCFSIGYSSTRHSSSHRVFEVYGDDVPSKKWTHYLTKLCNIVFGRNNQTKQDRAKQDSMVNEEEIENKENLETSKILKQENKSIQCSTYSDSIMEPSTMDRNLIEKLNVLLATLFEQNEKLEQRKQNIDRYDKSRQSICDLLNDQQNLLLTVIDHLKNVMENSQHVSPPASSTPNRLVCNRNAAVASTPLTHSIHGASINKSYLDANKSYYSISDMSTWFHNKQTQKVKSIRHGLDSIYETSQTDTDMQNFRELLFKVKNIVEDSHSDNQELAEATYNLETVLDGIIRNEEVRRLAP